MTFYLSKFETFHRKLSLASSFTSGSGCKYEPSHCICLGALEGSGFDLGKTDSYERWFNDDSVVQLAEAGEFSGLKGIREYVNLAVSSEMVITKLEEWMLLEQVPIPESIEYDPATRECTVALVRPVCDTFSPLTLGGSIDYNRGAKVKFVIKNIPSVQDPRAEIIVKRLDVFFPHLYYEEMNRVIRTEAVATRICDIMESDCPRTFAKNFPGTTSITSTSNSSSTIDIDGDDSLSCIDKLLGLKHQNATGMLDGNTIGCRLLHASLAKKNSDHCQHISFIPEEDRNGKIKCQKPKGFAASNLFTEFELDVFENFKSELLVSDTFPSSNLQYYENSTCRDRYHSRMKTYEHTGFGVIVCMVVCTFLIMVTMNWIGYSTSSLRRTLFLEKCHADASKAESERSKMTYSESINELRHSSHTSGSSENHGLGPIVNKIVETNAQLNTGGPQKCWGYVIAVLFATFASLYLSLLPLVLLVIEPSIRGPCNMNFSLLDKYIDRFHEEDHIWGITDSHPMSKIARLEFSVYVGFLIWLWANIIGFGFEVFFAVHILENGWTSKHEEWWRLAQHIFPLSAIVMFGLAVSRSYVALFFLFPSGLWKCGFPETVAAMHSALFDSTLNTNQRMYQFFDSIGLVWHHSSASLVICMLVTGVAKPEQSITEPLLILCAQHSIALLRYWYSKTYIAIALGLELCFQWMVFSNLELYALNHWTVVVAAIGVVLAHWMWWCVGIYTFMTDFFRKRRDSSNADTEIESSETDAFDA